MEKTVSLLSFNLKPLLFNLLCLCFMAEPLYIEVAANLNTSFVTHFLTKITKGNRFSILKLCRGELKVNRSKDKIPIARRARDPLKELEIIHQFLSKTLKEFELAKSSTDGFAVRECAAEGCAARISQAGCGPVMESWRSFKKKFEPTVLA